MAEPERNLFGEEVGPTPEEKAAQTRKEVAGSLVRGWLKMQEVRPSNTDIGKQAKAAQRIAIRDPEHVACAIVGIQQLFPYSNGTPWDMFDLERKFVKAVAAGRTALKARGPTGIAAIMEARNA